MSAQVSEASYVLGLADDALIYAQRLGEWIARAPQIEEDLALGNIGLDLLGQARALLTHVGASDGTGRTEDDLAMLRDERDFRCVHLVQQPGSDFGFEMARLLAFATYQAHLYVALTGSSDATVAAVAAKAVKEVAYHRDHAEQWVIRLGDGTAQSHERMQAGVQQVWPYLPELFDDDAAAVAAAEAGVGVLPSRLAEPVMTSISRVLQQATLTVPETSAWRSRGGRDGVHSRPMGYLLAEMQHVARSHPGASW